MKTFRLGPRGRLRVPLATRFDSPENSLANLLGLHAFGLHRRWEKFHVDKIILLGGRRSSGHGVNVLLNYCAHFRWRPIAPRPVQSRAGASGAEPRSLVRLGTLLCHRADIAQRGCPMKVARRVPLPPGVGWVKRSADPTQAAISAGVGSSPGLRAGVDPTYFFCASLIRSGRSRPTPTRLPNRSCSFATSAAGSGGRRIEAMLARKWATLPVPNSTTSMPGVWRA